MRKACLQERSCRQMSKENKAPVFANIFANKAYILESHVVLWYKIFGYCVKSPLIEEYCGAMCMERAKLKRKKDCITISHKLKKDEQLNAVEFDIISKGEVPAFFPVQVSHSVLGTELRFLLLPLPSLAERLLQGMDFGQFCTYALDLVQTIQHCEAHGIKVGNLELRTEYIFCEEDHLRLLYWPVISSVGRTTDIPQVFKMLGENYHCPADDEGYAEAYLALFKTRMKFDIFHFQKALQRLRDAWYERHCEGKPIPAESSVNAILLAHSGGGVICVDKFPFTFGRDPETCDYSFSGDRKISRTHMSLHSHDGKIYIYDNRSLNGTRINGAVIASECRTEISPGDVIQLGEQELIYVSDETGEQG